MGKDFLDDRVMDAIDLVKSAIQGGGSFCHQDMDMRMEVDALA